LNTVFEIVLVNKLKTFPILLYNNKMGKVLSTVVDNICIACEGTGRYPSFRYCYHCHGTGYIYSVYGNFFIKKIINAIGR
jgi:RecJ-like exonuclease